MLPSRESRVSTRGIVCRGGGYEKQMVLSTKCHHEKKVKNKGLRTSALHDKYAGE